MLLLLFFPQLRVAGYTTNPEKGLWTTIFQKVFSVGSTWEALWRVPEQFWAQDTLNTFTVTGDRHIERQSWLKDVVSDWITYI